MLYFVYIIACILLAIGIAILIKNRIKFVKQIEAIPGPPTTPVIGNLTEICCAPEKLWHILRKFSRDYFPIYRVWACHMAGVFIISPEDTEILLSSTKHLQKSQMYQCLHEWLGNGLLTSTGNTWHLRRKLLTPAFHFSILKEFLVVFSEQSDVLINRLRKECDKPYTNVVPQVSEFTLNSICETAMGITPDLLASKQESYISSIYKMGGFVVYRIIRPWLYFSTSFVFTAAFWQQKKLTHILHSISLNVIRKRKCDTEYIASPKEGKVTNTSVKKKRLAMLDLLISAQKSEQLINDEGIREEVDTFMFEGHDTTAVCICFTLMLLACNQDIQEKVRKEVSELIETSPEKYSYENLQELKYLEMVIKESLRLYPSVPLIARLTSEDIRTNSGYLIPADVTAVVLIYDIHHNSLYYPNPEKFDPYRFLPENCKNRHPFAYIPFSAGPRNCIGQKFAMLELKMVIAKIVQNFKLLPVDTPDTVTITTDLLLRPSNGIKVKFEKRTS